MKILKDSITELASKGQITLQVSDFYIFFDGTEDETENVPDEWLCILHGHRVATGKEQGYLYLTVATGKEQGYLYLTRKGYEVNKDKLRKAFEQAIVNGNDRTNGQGWRAFEEYAEKHFQYIEKATRKYQETLRKKIEQIQQNTP